MTEKIKELFNLPNALPQELVNYVIIYLRKSRKDMEFQKDEPIEKTLQRHETMLQDWAKNVFGCKIPEKNIFREVVSGDTIAERPEIQKVLSLIESDNAKAVLCIEIERLARGNTIDQGVIAEKFQLTDTKIFTPGKIFDLNDDFDLNYFEEGLHQARHFLKYIKKILIRGKNQSANEGKFPNSTAPFGYDRVKLKGEKGFILQKNEDSKIVKKIFDLYIYDDLGTTNIAKELNRLGMHSPSGRNWTESMVRSRINRRETYAGYMTWNKRKEIRKFVNGEIIKTRPVNKDYIKVQGKHEPIITKKELALVENKMNKLSVQKIPDEYEMKNPLCGIVKCAFCGCSMQRRNYTMSYVKKGTIHKDTLLCKTSGCKNVSSDLDIVENSILEYLKKTLQDYKDILQNYDTNSTTETEKYTKELKLLQKKADELSSQKQRCCELLEKGIYDENTFQSRMQKLNEDLEKTNVSIKSVTKKLNDEKKEKYTIAVPIIQNCIELYDKLNIEQKNNLLSSIIEYANYKKTNKNGRWDINARTDFELEIKLKI